MKYQQDLEGHGMARLEHRPEMDLPSYKYPDSSFFSDNFGKTLISSIIRRDACNFPILLGTQLDVHVEDMFDQPNLLVGGTTGSGKTQFLYNQIAFWLCYKHPSRLKFVFFGSKTVDYHMFSKLKYHFCCGTGVENEIVNPSDFCSTLKALICEVDRRIQMFTLASVKTIKEYNGLIEKQLLNPNSGHCFLPDIAVIIDDLYNFCYNEDSSDLLILLTQRNLYTGVYVLAATSQVNSSTISKQLRSNFIFRAAFRLLTQSDSKQILNDIGADKLDSPGELIFNFKGTLRKARQPIVEYQHLLKLVNFIGCQIGYSHPYQLYNPDARLNIDFSQLDSTVEDAARLVVMHQQGSTSLIQRKLKLGYNRAGRIIDQLEAIGVVGPFEGSKAREVLIEDDYALELLLNKFRDIQSQSKK